MEVTLRATWTCTSSFTPGPQWAGGSAADLCPPDNPPTLLPFAKTPISSEQIDKHTEKQQRRPRGPRQLSEQEITQDLKYGISAKGSSDTGLAQDVNNMQIHANLKSHYPLSFPEEGGLEPPRHQMTFS